MFVMLEESIESSPCKSVRRLRCPRRKKNEEKAAQVLQEKLPNQILQKFYFDSDEDCSDNCLVKYFDPYKRNAFKSLSKKVNNKNFLSSKASGLQNCVKPEKGCGSSSPQIFDVDITETELLKCCQEADEMLQRKSNGRFCLVNSILRDFDLSPYSGKTENVPKFWEYSPEFVLKSKPRLTYSSKRNKSTSFNCNKRLHFNDDCPGSISVQDKTMHEDEANTTFIVPDATETLCENLLNLSAFFSQTPSSHTSEEINDYSSIIKRVSDIQEECLELRKNNDYLIEYRYSSLGNFHGFPEAGISQKDLEPDINVSQSSQFDDWDKEECDIFALIKTPPKSCENKSRINENLKELKGFTTASSKQIHISEEAKSKAAMLIKKLPDLKPNEQLMKSNDVYSNRPSSSKTTGDYDNGFETDSSNQINASSVNLPNNLLEIGPKQNQEQYNDQPSTSKLALQQNREYLKRASVPQSNNGHFSTGFQTAKGRVIKPTPKAQRSIQNLLKEFQTDCEPIEENHLERLKTSIYNKLHKDVPNKVTQMSKTEEEFLAEMVFSEWPLEEELKFMSSQKHKIKENTPKDTGNDINQKTYEISRDHSDRVYENTKLTDEGITHFVPQIKVTGFQTANGKCLKPSSAAMKRIETFLKDFKSDCEQFGEHDEKPINLESKNLQLKEAKDMAIPTSVNKATIFESNLRSSEFAINLQEETSTFEPPIKGDSTQNEPNYNLKYQVYSTSKNNADSLNTPIIMKCNQNKSSSLMELSVKSPLNKSLTKSIISRKNLLSMSKRKKKQILTNAQKETTNTNLSTPIKIDSGKTIQSPSTPNVTHSVVPVTKCSTPCVVNEMDNDIKPISWNDSNNMISAAADNSPKPSDTDRLVNLRKDFNFSPISPIIINRCRTSGLKRPRSMLKKD